jgi:hypothetical protein
MRTIKLRTRNNRIASSGHMTGMGCYPAEDVGCWELIDSAWQPITKPIANGELFRLMLCVNRKYRTVTAIAKHRTSQYGTIIHEAFFPPQS